jgi:DNA polymerase elongation subunit (family B)
VTVGLMTRSFFGERREKRVLLCLLATAPVPGCEVRSFETEAELLLAFGQELRASDADVVAGYNSCAFDWRYLRDRAKLLEARGELTAELLFLPRALGVFSPDRATVVDACAGYCCSFIPALCTI